VAATRHDAAVPSALQQRVARLVARASGGRPVRARWRDGFAGSDELTIGADGLDPLQSGIGQVVYSFAVSESRTESSAQQQFG
jgi:hypothetical protein